MPAKRFDQKAGSVPSLAIKAGELWLGSAPMPYDLSPASTPFPFVLLPLRLPVSDCAVSSCPFLHPTPFHCSSPSHTFPFSMFPIVPCTCHLYLHTPTTAALPDPRRPGSPQMGDRRCLTRKMSMPGPSYLLSTRKRSNRAAKQGQKRVPPRESLLAWP